jgi:hypothetical protein
LSDDGPDWSRPVYLWVYDKDQVDVWLIARNCFLSSHLRNTVCSIDHWRHHLMVLGTSVFIFSISLYSFVCIFHLLWVVVGLTVLWGMPFFWDQGVMSSNPLTSSSILSTGRRAGHYSWGVLDLIHCIWIDSFFPNCWAYGKSSRYFIFIYYIAIW